MTVSLTNWKWRVVELDGVMVMDEQTKKTKPKAGHEFRCIL